MKNTIKKMGLGMVAFGMLSSMPMNSYAMESQTPALEQTEDEDVKIDESILTEEEIADGVLSNGFVKYKVIENDEIEIVKILKKDGDIAIPKEIDGKKVTTIGKHSFMENSNGTSIEIKSDEIFNSNIREIKEYGLNHVTIIGDIFLDTKVTLGIGALINTTVEGNVILKNSKATLKDATLQGTKIQGNVEITDSKIDFADRMFSQSTIDGDFTFKNNSGEIGDYTLFDTTVKGNVDFLNFEGTSKGNTLQSAKIQGNLNLIDNLGFSDSEFLFMEVSGVTTIENTSLGDATLQQIKVGKLNLTLNDDMLGRNFEEHPEYVAQYSDIGDLNLQGTIDYLPKMFFTGSTINKDGKDLDIKLNIIGKHADKEDNIEYGEQFSSVNFGGNVTFSGEIKELPGYFLSNAKTIDSNQISKITFKNDIETLNNGGLSNAKFNEIYLKNVGDMRNRQFMSTDKLTDIYVDGDVGKIGGFDMSPVFYNSASIHISGDVGTIHPISFVGYNGKLIDIKGNVGKISSSSFPNSLGDMVINIGGDVGEIEKEGFANLEDMKLNVNGDIGKVYKDSIKNAKYLDIKGTVKENPDGFGFSENGFVKFNIGKGIENIYEGMFSNSLNKDNQDLYIDLPKNILTGNKIVGDNAFKDGAFKGELNFSDTNKNLGVSSFENNKFTKLNLSNSLIELPTNVFRNNNITTVKLPKGLKTINEGALANNKIACITLPRGLEKIEPSALKQKDNMVIDVYAKKDKGYEDLFKDLSYINLKEDNVFTNECEDNTWGVNIKHITTDGKVLKEENIVKPKEQKMVINSEKFDGYVIQGENKQEITISDETPSHDVVFTYIKEKPPVIVPPTEEKPDVKPPVIVPPTEEKPDVKPPVIVPPTEEKPEIKPPVVVPPTEEKPEIKPPVTVPPVEDNDSEKGTEEDLPTDNLILDTESENIDKKEEKDKPVLNETNDDTTEIKEDMVIEELPKTGSEDTSYGLVGFMMMLVSFIFFGRKKKSGITNID